MRKECVKALAVEKVVPKDKEGAFRLYADMSMEQQRKYGIPASVHAVTDGYGDRLWRIRACLQGYEFLWHQGG